MVPKNGTGRDGESGSGERVEGGRASGTAIGAGGCAVSFSCSGVVNSPVRVRGEGSEKALIRAMKENSKTWKDWDAEYICDKIEILCQALGLEIVWTDFAGVRTFGDVCDAICVSLAWRYRDGGGLQQAFYKLRKAIAEVKDIDTTGISMDTRWEELFPRRGRRRLVRRLEMSLGSRLHLLEPKRWVVITMVVMMSVSFFSILGWWLIGLIGLVGGFFGYWLAVWFGREFRYATLGEVAMDLAQNGYIYAGGERKGSVVLTRAFGGEQGRVNLEEMVKIIEDWFRKELELAPEELRRGAEIF